MVTGQQGSSTRSRDCARLGLCHSPSPGAGGPQYKSSKGSIEQTNKLTGFSAETHNWLLFGKIRGSSVCQLVKVTEEPLDHSKETGVLLLLKPIHVSDAFSVRDKYKLLTGILLNAKEILHWGYYQNISLCK